MRKQVIWASSVIVMGLTANWFLTEELAADLVAMDPCIVCVDGCPPNLEAACEAEGCDSGDPACGPVDCHFPGGNTDWTMTCE